MVYDPLDPVEIESGKPAKEELFQKIHNNMEGFNADIEALKQTSQFDIVNVKITGEVNQYNADELNSRMPTFKSPIDVLITSIIITLLSPSTSGTLELWIDKSTDNGMNWTPQLDSPVELTGITTGSISGAVNFTSPALQELDQNDLMRLRITGAQVDQGEFHISIYGEVSS